MNKMKYIIATNWCYPFGGGEEFMYQTMEWAVKLFNAECYWISFANSKKENHGQFEIKKDKYGTHIYLSGGFNEKNLCMWFKILKPDLVHHQGNFREEFYTVCEILRINFLSGFHFWTGGIKLDPETYNRDILKNSPKHLPDEELLRITDKKFCHLYTVSPFVKECIQKIANVDIKNMIYSGSAFSRYKIDQIDTKDQIYVTCINIHKVKGGEILLDIIKRIPNLPYIAIQTEHESEDLDAKIKETLEENNKKHRKNNIYMTRCENPIEIYKKTKILLAPSLCDETFCRTVNEAMMNGIPVITTGQGNIKYLVGERGLVYQKDNIDGWVDEIKKLYYDNNYYQQQKEYHLNEYTNFSEETASKMFNDVCKNIMKKSKLKNVMIFTPWCDQGLGIQSRNYHDILINNNYSVFIFGVKPYNAATCIELQKDSKEWETNNIYYSSNDRENITDIELKEFVQENNIGQCLIPETCFSRIFEIAKLFRSLDVLCYAIPNIEIVRKTEVFKHNYFYKILCNNYLCQNIFDDHDTSKTGYIGYGMKKRPEMKHKDISDSNPIKFLFIGGMNAFSRKHILDICEGFASAYQKNKNIYLTCTVQKTNNLEVDLIQKIDEYKEHPNINIIFNHMKYQDILNLYYDHHISIQMSKHEGLGLGFYEAIYTGTPIITLNTPPHNEIVRDKVNGWIVDCYYKKMTDNKDPIFDSAYFKSDILCQKILEITENREELNKIYDNLFKDYNDRLSYEIFEKRFLESIK
jgi:glycosyltransferase involved in cell wall biosynthesis